MGLLQHGALVALPVRESRDDPVAGDARFERDAAALVDGGEAALLHQRQDAEDLPRAVLVALLLDALAQRADVLASYSSALEQLLDLRRRARTAVLRWHAEVTVLRAQMLAQQHAGLRVDDAHAARIPPDVHVAVNPAGRRCVVGLRHLDAAIEVHGAHAVLVVAKRLDGERQQRRLLLGKHQRNLALHRAVDARVGPTGSPVVEVALRLIEALEALAGQRRLLREAN